MRALILVAGAALAVSACSSNEAAENTMNVDETLTTENVVENDATAIDATNAADAAPAPASIQSKTRVVGENAIACLRKSSDERPRKTSSKQTWTASSHRETL